VTRPVRDRAGRLFDRLEEIWEGTTTQKWLANLLVIVFVGGLLVIEARRQGWLPEPLALHLPTSHFMALHVAFTLLLLFEVIGLVLGVARSVSRAVGQQLEIVSLILIRQSFKELAHLQEPIVWEELSEVIPFIISDAVGALLIFVTLGLYYRLLRHQPFTERDEQTGFVGTKKLIVLLLLVAMAAIGLQGGWQLLHTGRLPSFFEAFYTLLIFADVLLVLVSMRYSCAYHVVFRYFGFALATVLVRLALTAPRFWDAGLALAATLFAVALTWAYNNAARAEATSEEDSTA
jgi:hypothetical protein